MPIFYAPAPKGLKSVLIKEFTNLHFNRVTPLASGITFEGPWTECYRANIESRIANRILKPLIDFIAYKPDEFYGHIKKHDFTKYIIPSQALQIEASVTDSMLKDQRFVALKAKDAIVDQFREKYGIRPNVDKISADLNIIIYGKKNHFHVYLDTSGEPLFQRGYRLKTGEAPIKETLAAGLLYLINWDQKTPIVDPFCGSGTLLIEAALILKNIAPGLLKKKFAFQNFKNFSPDQFQKLVTKLSNQEITSPIPLLLYGFDENPRLIAMAKENAKRAGVENLIQFRTKSITQLKPPVEKGLILTNPPYGHRLGNIKDITHLYKDFSHVLKESFHDWNVWLLSGDPELSKFLKLKTNEKYQVFNGNIECRLLKYHIKKGSYSTRIYRSSIEN